MIHPSRLETNLNQVLFYPIHSIFLSLISHTSEILLLMWHDRNCSGLFLECHSIFTPRSTCMAVRQNLTILVWPIKFDYLSVCDSSVGSTSALTFLVLLKHRPSAVHIPVNYNIKFISHSNYFSSFGITYFIFIFP